MPHRDPRRLGPPFERWRAGDGQAWNDLLGKPRPYLKALIRSWLGADLASAGAAAAAVERAPRVRR
jgi:hypothetical protein